MKIGYQGTIGSFSQIASLNLFPNDELINYLSFREVVDGVSNGTLNFGVLPIENSYTGEVGMVLDELFKSNIFITGVYDLPIVQNLVGIKGAKLHEIKRVYSHEQALMQCSKVLSDLGVETVSFTNTALASQYIKELNDPTKAAIASDLAVKVNGLEILLPAINDNPNNTTRFAIISKELKEIKENFPDKDIWLYTGHIFENINSYLVMKYIDVLVDGQYVDELHDPTLKWRGSSNQRVIDVPKSLATGDIITIV